MEEFLVRRRSVAGAHTDRRGSGRMVTFSSQFLVLNS
ncbi:MAG: hypothetical protein KatS3mg058_4572 [Roseiflexus sp.]|nr:MAG: hypothetical protein KatS3mg058_4572 [Roseiflexus sp.]